MADLEKRREACPCPPAASETIARPGYSGSKLWRSKIWTICSLGMIMGLILAMRHWAIPGTQGEESCTKGEVCLSPQCVVAAANIIENMSPNHRHIDPCQHFDRFVCDGFDEKHDLRADQSSLFTGTIMAEAGQQLLRHVLESPYPHDAMTASSDNEYIFSVLQDAYNACFDEETVQSAGAEPLLKVFSAIRSLYPIDHMDVSRSMDETRQVPFSSSTATTTAISQTLAFTMKIGLAPLITFFVSPDDKDPDTIVPFLNAPRRPGLPSKEYYEDVQRVKSYTEVIHTVMGRLLHKLDNEDMTQNTISISRYHVEALVAFESALAKATPNTEDAEDVTFYYNPMTIQEIEALAPPLSLSILLESLAPSAPEPSKIIVESPKYLKALGILLTETKPEVIQLYFLWKAVQALADEIEDPSTEALRKFNNELQGKDADAKEERWRTCVKHTDRGLGWILSKFFVEKAFSAESRDLGNKIVSDIKTEFVEKLKGIDWMSDIVKELGAEKVHAIVQKIGYPVKSPDVRNATALRAYYQHVRVQNDTFFANALSMAEADIRRRWSALGKPTNRDEWDMTADTVNAYYNPPGNEIVFPAGIMQSPVFYDPSVPQYLSYGAFGAVSGHELSHAFDSLGRHYDVHGNYTDWWDNATVASFEERAECFVAQYAQFTVDNPNGSPLHVNGRLTLGENIADAGGLNAAFAAWQKIEARHSSKTLPGLQEFSKEQVFFMSYANFWCGKIRPEAAVQYIYQDPHSPTWARILGTLANSRGFRESFDCPVREPTCELW